jgi:hypothetical protein
LIVNTENGKAVVADIADASRNLEEKHMEEVEVMDYLGGPRYKKALWYSSLTILIIKFLSGP